MSIENISLHVSPTIGEVSGIYNVPENAQCIMTLAHGAGAAMHHSFMELLADALSKLQIATLRFNFPFMENKKGRPDLPVVAHATIEAALLHAQQKFSMLPIYLSGKSFGGRMSSQYLALQAASPVKGIIFYGFPLHPPKKPAIDRAEHLKQVNQPMLFIQGTKDALAEWALIEQVCASLPEATLIKIDGADHAFKKGKENVVPRLAEMTKEWMENKG